MMGALQFGINLILTLPPKFHIWISAMEKRLQSKEEEEEEEEEEEKEENGEEKNGYIFVVVFSYQFF